MDVSHHSGQVEEISEKLEKSMTIDTDDKMETYHRYIRDGKEVARQGNMPKALELFKLAYGVHPSEKLKSRIKRIEEVIAQQGSESEDEEFVNINNSGLMLFRELHDKLYEHQRDGVAFLYSLYRDGRKGGILADDMGLGKTIQVISFLSGMYDAELVKHTLLVMPTSLITNWTKEFAKWTPGMRVKEFHGTSKAERTRNLEKIQRRGGVIITTYQMLINNWQLVASYGGQEFKWDYMILDEAHKIKTASTKTAKSAYAIPARNRVLLTGTPVQNNLREMWALFDFACQGTLLGTAKTFKTEYENPITRAREKDATPGEKALGFKMSENLMAIINPYFLRRTKAEVQKKKMNSTQVKEQYSDNKDGQVPNHPKEAGAVMPTLTRKNDLIVWTYLSAIQEDIYRQFLSLDHIKELLMTSRSPLAELTILKKLCDHPRLLSAAAMAQLGLEENTAESQQDDDTESAAHSIANVPDETLISESGKLVFLIALLERLKQEGHRTLIFAHYRKVLDIIERVLGNRGFKTMRLDGTITQLAEREKRISLFQTDKRYSVFLLTTQVGGVGITLTAANRVVIYDPSWNPATDAQAVDRAYRIGQTENVVIYRLITCGTVEEKIYRRQIFKDSLIRQTTGDKKNPFRYFSKQELKELFTLQETRSSSTQMQLQSLHSRHRRTDPELDEHIAYLHTMEMFGISDHDLMFSLDVNHDEAPEDQEAHNYIEGRVQKAQELMKAESELQMQLAESMASSTEPAWLRQPDQHNRERSNEKKPRNARPSPSFPQPHDSSNRSPVVVELDPSGSGEEDGGQDLSNQVIDLTVDESMTEEQPVPEVHQDKLAELNLDSPKHQSFKKEPSDFEAADDSVQEVMEESLVMTDVAAAEAGDASLEYVTAIFDEDEQQQNEMSLSTYSGSKNQLFAGGEGQHVTPLRNKRLSVLQMSNASLKADASSKLSTGLESFEGNFNLQLEDSDMFPDNDMMEEETENQEMKLLSQLQMEGSFNVDKSLRERRDKEEIERSINGSHVSELNGSMDNSIITTKKKRAAVIYDSEEEEENDDDGQQSESSQLEESFQALGASTPKLVRSGSTPLKSRKSVGGNTSVASRHSLVQSMIEDVENLDEDMADEDDGDDDYYSEDVSDNHSDISEGEEISGSSGDKLQLEETNGETLNTEDEEESEKEEEEEEESYESEDAAVESASGEEVSSNPEESTSDPELASTERMDQCAADPALTDHNDEESLSNSEDGSYDFLVRRGKQCHSEGKLDDALGFLLRAIDITPGDPEVQLMTIQLYRQLSQRTQN
ncbi:DNA excision repair protein ERCC-6-like [Centroberyx affinis]|uniref:DNA excision repair protein ERCC-6-like n=1 Tax=Centroberyx affinis TaxID=166261 RepID=UPI003A5C73E1